MWLRWLLRTGAVALLAAGLVPGSVGRVEGQPVDGRAILDSPACRRSCNAASPERMRNTRDVQVCLVRCTAGEQHMARPQAPGGEGIRRPSTAVGGGPDGPVMMAYAGAPPSRAVAVSAAGMTRETAHRLTQQNCSGSNSGRPCTLLGESQERCVAVVQGARVLGVLATAHASTSVVAHYSFGAGPDPRRAEQEAMSSCTSRVLPQVACSVVAQGCR